MSLKASIEDTVGCALVGVPPRDEAMVALREGGGSSVSKKCCDKGYREARRGKKKSKEI